MDEGKLEPQSVGFKTFSSGSDSCADDLSGQLKSMLYFFKYSRGGGPFRSNKLSNYANRSAPYPTRGRSSNYKNGSEPYPTRDSSSNYLSHGRDQLNKK